jgi:hypothetical protein
MWVKGACRQTKLNCRVAGTQAQMISSINHAWCRTTVDAHRSGQLVSKAAVSEL